MDVQSADFEKTPAFQKGWRQIWSFRKNRYYFWNKDTCDSQWDPPKPSDLKEQITPAVQPQRLLSANHFKNECDDHFGNSLSYKDVSTGKYPGDLTTYKAGDTDTNSSLSRLLHHEGREGNEGFHLQVITTSSNKESESCDDEDLLRNVTSEPQPQSCIHQGDSSSSDDEGFVEDKWCRECDTPSRRSCQSQQHAMREGFSTTTKTFSADLDIFSVPPRPSLWIDSSSLSFFALHPPPFYTVICFPAPISKRKRAKD